MRIYCIVILFSILIISLTGCGNPVKGSSSPEVPIEQLENGPFGFKVSKLDSTGKYLFVLKNNSNRTIRTSPIGSNNNFLFFADSNGRKGAYAYNLTLSEYPIVKPNETIKWEKDLYKIMDYFEIDRDAHATMTWSVNGVKSQPFKIE